MVYCCTCQLCLIKPTLDELFLVCEITRRLINGHCIDSKRYWNTQSLVESCTKHFPLGKGTYETEAAKDCSESVYMDYPTEIVPFRQSKTHAHMNSVMLPKCKGPTQTLHRPKPDGVPRLKTSKKNRFPSLRCYL